jgi:hypothetical protein
MNSAECRASKSWAVHVGADFLDIPMSDQARVLLLRLESMARTKTYCFPGNDRLASAVGKRTGAIKCAFKELERLGWICRVYSDARRRNRIGVVMLRRVDPMMPFAANAEEIEAAAIEIVAGFSTTRAGRGRFFVPEVPLRLNGSSMTHRGNSTSAYDDSAARGGTGGIPEGRERHHHHQESLASERKPVTGGGAGEPGDFGDEETRRDFERLAAGVKAIAAWPPGRQGLRAAVNRLASEFHDILLDEGSLDFHRKTLWRVRSGEVDAGRVIDALSGTLKATAIPGATVENPPARYVYLLKKLSDAEVAEEARQQDAA